MYSIAFRKTSSLREKEETVCCCGRVGFGRTMTESLKTCRHQNSDQLQLKLAALVKYYITAAFLDHLTSLYSDLLVMVPVASQTPSWSEILKDQLYLGKCVSILPAETSYN